jgi:4-hydroxybenzoate polyprenyltransferase
MLDHLIYKSNLFFIFMIKDYLKLVKFRYHLTFFSVIIGALFFAEKIDLYLFYSLLLVYISFNVFMYTGLYTINDIFDRKSDAAHPKKRKRVIASGKISVLNAFIFAIIVICIGLLIAFFSFKKLFYIYLIFIFFNIFYTFIGKKFPYLEILSNSFTYPLRFFMGILLVGNSAPISLITAYFFVAIGPATLRRIVELEHKGYEARKVLLYYTKNKLILIEILALLLLILFFLIDFPKNLLLYSLFIIFYFVFVFLIGHSKKFRPILQKIWLN